ncbi:hypothetical protein [Massilia sp. CCM 8734]|uniref:hypothetical protein n=1 Tax=Massilia sp. CCM 8734 TaxID=2609283 RepID=UPI00141E0855|nr:hypothetical protein [Massilia sp. CCM 8734]NHZ94299.1 hypothetical protein [Massilia sp. CCM 8734]
MTSEKLRIKLLERRVRQFAAALDGLGDVRITMPAPGDFLRHRQALAQANALDAPTLRHWPHPVDRAAVLDLVCAGIASAGPEVHIPCGQPFHIVARIDDCRAFVSSIWRMESTLDLTLYFTSPAAVIALHDLEYALAYVVTALGHEPPQES